MGVVEARDVTLRFNLRGVLDEGYAGVLDGYGRLREFQDELVPRLVQAAVRAIRAQPGWTVRPANRGRPPEDEVTLLVEPHAA
jgi:hypothetical protein